MDLMTFSVVTLIASVVIMGLSVFLCAVSIYFDNGNIGKMSVVALLVSLFLLLISATFNILAPIEVKEELNKNSVKKEELTKKSQGIKVCYKVRCYYA